MTICAESPQLADLAFFLLVALAPDLAWPLRVKASAGWATSFPARSESALSWRLLVFTQLGLGSQFLKVWRVESTAWRSTGSQHMGCSLVSGCLRMPGGICFESVQQRLLRPLATQLLAVLGLSL